MDLGAGTGPPLVLGVIRPRIIHMLTFLGECSLLYVKPTIQPHPSYPPAPSLDQDVGRNPKRRVFPMAGLETLQRLRP